ncbi:MAG: hypothetical protein IIC41_06440, partial [Candidatus Marinimicrobia bacterium]|nr:hypothetical protein [Candidatus Neomarinimicrobiota bacterium]
MRLNKYLARAGVASRRKSDTLIAAGLVRVNGVAITELGVNVGPDDVVEANGQVLPALEGTGPCEGDANGDGTVDPLDSGFVLARFGCSVGTGDPSCDAADQNGDGAVDP